jgi:translation elongation factor EF-G
LALEALHLRIPDLLSGPIEVNYIEKPEPLEPYVRVRVAAPEDCLLEIFTDLYRRVGGFGKIARDGGARDDERRILTTRVPLAKFLGYDVALKKMTRDLGTVEYEFVGYQPLVDGSGPPDPRRPARAMRA